MLEMHDSRVSVTFLRCGHPMHQNCYVEYAMTNIACPLCKKSMVDPKAYEAQMDEQINGMQMPEEYKDVKMLIMCNDCLQRSEVKFHIMGGKCQNCKSYNTSRINDDQYERKIMEIQNKLNQA